MKRPCLDYAALPDMPVSQMPPAEQLICKLAWIGDNALYGVTDAVKRLIDDVRAGSFRGAVARSALIPASQRKPEGDALLLTTSKVWIIGDWYQGAWRTHRSWWHDDGGKMVLYSAFEENDITHWMPLPLSDGDRE